MNEILLYHGSKEEVVYPEIRITRYTKDFSWGFYCTNNYQQAFVTISCIYYHDVRVLLVILAHHGVHEEALATSRRT